MMRLIDRESVRAGDIASLPEGTFRVAEVRLHGLSIANHDDDPLFLPDPIIRSANMQFYRPSGQEPPVTDPQLDLLDVYLGRTETGTYSTADGMLLRRAPGSTATEQVGGILRPEDADLIVAALNALPSLIAEIRAHRDH